MKAPAELSPSTSETAPDDTTLDAFLGGRVHILQPRQSFRSGIDAVLLAAALPAGTSRARVLDAGSGVGVVGICAAVRVPDVQVVMIEREPRLASIARRNVYENGLVDRIDVVEMDLLQRGALSNMVGGRPFDHVLANPPYHIEGDGTQSADGIKARANAMAPGDLDRWVRVLAGGLAGGGKMTLIHRASALATLLSACDRHFGAAMVLPIHPRRGEPANRVIVQAVKGSRAPLTLLPGLVLHGAGHGFEPPVEGILRRGATLDMGG